MTCGDPSRRLTADLFTTRAAEAVIKCIGRRPVRLERKKGPPQRHGGFAESSLWLQTLSGAGLRSSRFDSPSARAKKNPSLGQAHRYTYDPDAAPREEFHGSRRISVNPHGTVTDNGAWQVKACPHKLPNETTFGKCIPTEGPTFPGWPFSQTAGAVARQ
jgi:hypothetical protein